MQTERAGMQALGCGKQTCRFNNPRLCRGLGITPDQAMPATALPIT